MELCNYGELWRLMTGHTDIEYGNETVTELSLEEAGGHGSSKGPNTPHIKIYMRGLEGFGYLVRLWDAFVTPWGSCGGLRGSRGRLGGCQGGWRGNVKTRVAR